MVLVLHIVVLRAGLNPFLVNDVSGLDNQNQYGLLIGNCCNSNEFAGVTCLGEALLRTPKKAVGYIGATNSTYWDEDYYWR